MILTLLIVLAVFLVVSVNGDGGLEEFSPEHIMSMKEVILQNKEELAQKGYDLNIVDRSLVNLEFAKKYKQTFDEFFKGNTEDDKCMNFPNEAMSAYYLPVHKADLKEFLASEIVMDFPKAVRSKLQFLQFSSASPEKPMVFSDAFSRIYKEKNKEAQNQDEEIEKFEVGNLVIKAFLHEETWHILILSPSLVNANGNGCHFKKEFRDGFVGKSQDVQHWLAIKAVQSKDFVSTLVTFTPHVTEEDKLAKLGFEPVISGNGAANSGKGIIYRKKLELRDSKEAKDEL